MSLCLQRYHYHLMFILGLVSMFGFGSFVFHLSRKSTVRMSHSEARTRMPINVESSQTQEVAAKVYKTLYDETLSNQMTREVKILCMVMTFPENHDTKAIYVKKTWGRRCNKLLFMSSKADERLDVFVSPFNESREALWNKTRLAFTHMYENYINEFDWFLKADDDSYIVMENLRYLLKQYNPRTALVFGHRYAVHGPPEGYMAGGGYILSKKALQKFAGKLIFNETICKGGVDGPEDWLMGECLAHSAIFVDSRDELQGKRFFPIGVESHMAPPVVPSYWYPERLYYYSPDASTRCCSDTTVQFHYIPPEEMMAYEYYIYHVHPFGLRKHVNERIPQRKLLKEIIAASDQKSISIYFQNHTDFHNFDLSEES